MDIIDIILGKALTPQGKTTTYLAKAEKAAQAAAAAKTSADNAVAAVESITEQTNANNASAQEALAAADEALERVNSALETLENEGITTETIDDEIDNLLFSITSTTNSDAVTNHLMVDYPSGETDRIANLVVMYQSEGQNTNGTMTQKAITNYVNQETGNLTSTIANIETRLATAESSIAHGGGGSGAVGNLGSENAGNIVVVGEHGEVTAGDTTEAAIIEALIKAGTYQVANAVGLDLDYENKIYIRTQESTNYSAGAEFNKYSMFGGRMRCNVNDSGAIVAWYGDNDYRDDGSNGQVMVYQPKFYYQRVLISYNGVNSGRAVRHEALLLSAAPLSGFKLHPLFKNENGDEVNYVLLPAYDGGLYDTSENAYSIDDTAIADYEADKLSSVAGVKPVSGKNHRLTIAAAEQLANNRGKGWHITNMRAESANQMLMMVEYGTPNLQVAIENGLTQLNSNLNYNCAATTGSTQSLGNTTGHATVTSQLINDTITTYTNPGQRAVSYRGMENPWGNIWHYLGDVIVFGNGNTQGGTPYICDTYNWDPSSTDGYTSIGFNLPNSSDAYISAFGYGNSTLDWVFLPIEVSSSANNLLPIGDTLWTTSSLRGTHIMTGSGPWNFGDKSGPFQYSCDYDASTSARNYGAKLMFIPELNTTYVNNYNHWLQKVGG